MTWDCHQVTYNAKPKIGGRSERPHSTTDTSTPHYLSPTQHNRPSCHTTYTQIMHTNLRHHRLANGHTNHSLNIHRFIPKLHNKKRETQVEDLSEKLIPILGKVKLAAVIHNLFTPQECAALIKLTEQKGYHNALVHGPNGNEILRQDIRNSGRCIIDDAALATSWYDRLLTAIEGTTVKQRMLSPHKNHNANSNRTLRAVGLNERLRFLRYTAGQYFGLHRDNAYIRDEFGERQGEESHLTFLLYLNDKMEGGQTRIGNESEGRYLDVCPEVGAVLIFDHDVLHEAVTIEKGIKYCCRTDVMFKVEEEGV
jgi:hypothetical protein